MTLERGVNTMSREGAHGRKILELSGGRAATLEYYRSLTPEQRLDILFELIEASRKEGDAASERFERVYRIIKLSPEEDT